MMCSVYVVAQQDSIVVKLTELQAQKFQEIKEQERKILEQYREVLQQLQNRRNELILLIADFNEIKREEIQEAKPEDNQITFKVKK